MIGFLTNVHLFILFLWASGSIDEQATAYASATIIGLTAGLSIYNSHKESTP